LIGYLVSYDVGWQIGWGVIVCKGKLWFRRGYDSKRWSDVSW